MKILGWKTALIATLLTITSFSSNALEIIEDNLLVFDFSAICFDCDAPFPGDILPPEEQTEVTGQLVLNNYQLGEEINEFNFVSFTYNGPSNHVSDFTVDDTNLLFVFGFLGADGEEEGSDLLHIQWFNDDLFAINEFFSIDGDWEIFAGDFEQPADFGTNAQFTPVPEPGAIMLFGLGLILLARRR